MLFLKKFLVIGVIGFNFLLPAVGFAAEAKPPKFPPGQCACFCATGTGAVQPAGKKVTTPAECQKSCDAMKGKFLLCTTNTSQYPSNNLRCWTKTLCETPTKVGDKMVGGIWDSAQPPECLEDQHYCYPKGEGYTLAVPFVGKKQTVAHLGDYVGQLYDFLLGFSVTVAIIMLMVGGLQYVLGAASGEQVEKAKSRIKNAVIGLIILFSAALLLQTVSPRIIGLQPPYLPMVRRVETPKAKSCDAYTSKEVCEKDADKAGGATGCLWHALIGGGRERCTSKSGLTGRNGGPCTGSPPTCAGGLKCVRALPAGGGGFQYVCSDGQVGSPCGTTDDCAANAYGSPTCVDYQCSGSTGTAQGGACTQTRDCAEGLKCDSNVCVLKTKVGRGEACVTTNDCSSGYACRNNKCGVEPPLDNGGGCWTGSDCKSGAACLIPGNVFDCKHDDISCVCSDKLAGAPCFMNQNCVSNNCSRNTAPYTDLGICQ